MSEPWQIISGLVFLIVSGLLLFGYLRFLFLGERVGLKVASFEFDEDELGDLVPRPTFEVFRDGRAIGMASSRSACSLWERDAGQTYPGKYIAKSGEAIVMNELLLGLFFGLVMVGIGVALITDNAHPILLNMTQGLGLLQ